MNISMHFTPIIVAYRWELCVAIAFLKLIASLSNSNNIIELVCISKKHDITYMVINDILNHNTINTRNPIR